jgi:multisubunit Na+/H+ antiporter MnhG subunit
MLALTALLIAVGAILAALGTLGFLAVWQAPSSHEDLQFARKAATIGRWLTIPGLCLYAGHYSASGLGLYALLAVTALAMASLITKTTTRPATTGAA